MRIGFLQPSLSLPSSSSLDVPALHPPLSVLPFDLSVRLAEKGGRKPDELTSAFSVPGIVADLTSCSLAAAATAPIVPNRRMALALAMADRHRARGSKFSRRPTDRSCCSDPLWVVSHA